MACFVVAHGAWSAGWAWKKMHPLMRAAGHELWTPTYTGLGERAHLVSPSVGLDTHIEDVLGVMTFEDLRDVVLIGHSYGGMVATGVADRARERISRLVYLDAFVPRDGESLFGLVGPAGRARMQELARTEGNGWLVPSNPIPPDTSEADVAWITPLRLPQPLKTFASQIRLASAETSLPRSYIYCQRFGPGDPFRKFAKRAKSERGWQACEIDASHSPHITAPLALRDLLIAIAGGTGTAAGQAAQ
jgi:pimeloyl-ACP methyl ester carboxylesterase